MVRHFIFGIKRCKYPFRLFYEEFGCDIRNIFQKQIEFLEEKKFIKIIDDTLFTTLLGALYADDIVRNIFPNGQEKATMGHQSRN